jgi:hypothetical protein
MRGFSLDGVVNKRLCVSQLESLGVVLASGKA